MEHKTEKIELHHHSIEEIMGAPPAKSIAWGSGTTLIILLVLLTGSVFINTPDTIQVNGVIYGQIPIEVLTASTSGQIIFQQDVSNKQVVQKGEALYYIKRNTTEPTIPVVASSTGILQINPLAHIRKNVFQNDTIGYIWNEQQTPVVCVLDLPSAIAQKIQIGQQIRVSMNIRDTEVFMYVEIKEKSDRMVTNQTQLIALLSDQQQGENLRGTLPIYTELTIGEKNLFRQLINPFRGLKK